jgi:hypothetical protein
MSEKSKDKKFCIYNSALAAVAACHAATASFLSSNQSSSQEQNHFEVYFSQRKKSIYS